RRRPGAVSMTWGAYDPRRRLGVPRETHPPTAGGWCLTRCPILLGAWLVYFFFAFEAGPLARFSASISKAWPSVTCSGAVPRGTVTLVAPSVMYGPNRPSLITTFLPDDGSFPNSAIGGFACPRPRRCLGFE